MTKETMNIHQALSEIKIIGKRIENELNGMMFCFYKKKSCDEVNGISEEKFRKNISSNYKSIMDLIKRRTAIKNAILISNAQTKVNICGVEYTVAEAIDMKNNTISILSKINGKFLHDFENSKKVISMENGEKLEKRMDEYIKSVFGTLDSKKDITEIKTAREDFYDSQSFVMVDPLEIENVIRKISLFINDFINHVDFSISTSNACTMIEIEY